MAIKHDCRYTKRRCAEITAILIISTFDSGSLFLNSSLFICFCLFSAPQITYCFIYSANRLGLKCYRSIEFSPLLF